MLLSHGHWSVSKMNLTAMQTYNHRSGNICVMKLSTNFCRKISYRNDPYHVNINKRASVLIFVAAIDYIYHIDYSAKTSINELKPQ